MLAQGVGHFVAHDHGDLIVRELQLLDDAGEKRNLAPGHAKRIHIIAANQGYRPLPVAGPLVPRIGVGNQGLGNPVQPLGLRVVGGHQGTFGLGLLNQLRILLVGGLFQVFGGHQMAQARGFAHLHLGPSGHGCCSHSAAPQLQKSAPRLPQAVPCTRMRAAAPAGGGARVGHRWGQGFNRGHAWLHFQTPPV